MNNSPTKTIYQVSQLTKQIQHMLEASYRSIWVEAEISSLSKPASGHWYFSLKDDQSQIRCAMFRGRINQNSYQAVDGDLVRVRGKVTVYAARGDMQMIIEHIEPAGEGLLQKQFEILKAKLQQEGLFDQQLKQKLPKIPKSIALITSPTGAAVQDVLSTLKRRFPSIPIRIYPTLVQGTEATEQIVSAIELANSSALPTGKKKITEDAETQTQSEVIILTRGGGSLEDLWCFNEEAVVRTIVASRLPVISAIGHEVDISLADFAADLRAPTPTAAAELAVPDMQDYSAQLSRLKQRFELGKDRYFSQANQNIDWLVKRLRHPKSQINQYQKRLMQLMHSIINIEQGQLENKKQTSKALSHRLHQIKLDQLLINKQQQVEKQNSQLQKIIRRRLADHRLKLDHIAKQISAVSYERTLDRGYAIIRDQTGKIITQSNDLKCDDIIEVSHADGSNQAIIQSKN